MRGHLALEIYFRARCLCVRENKLTRELLVYKDSFAIDTNRPFADVIVRTGMNLEPDFRRRVDFVGITVFNI